MEIEPIDDPCILTITCKPKEYFEIFGGRNTDKKHKGIKKESSGMGFEDFSLRISTLINFDTFEKLPHWFQKGLLAYRFRWRDAKKSIVESRFSQINDKRFYFADGINSMPLSHPYLRELIDFKQEMDRKLSDIFGKRKKLFEIENRAQNLNERLFLSH